MNVPSEQKMLVGARRLEVRKGEVLLRAGDKQGRGFYVASGCLRSYVIDSSGKEHVVQFAPEDWFVSDLKSMLRGVPASMFIDALEPSVVHEIDNDRARDTLSNDPATQAMMFEKAHNRMVTLQDRVIELLAASGEERYLRFIKTYPGLMQRLPQKLIASYLGVTPESLSRIRRSIAGHGGQE